MFDKTFDHNIIRKYTVLFGALFNDLYITRKNSTEEIVETVKIPLSYAPKNKLLTRLRSDPDLSQPFAVNLPRISFELVGLTYAANRKLQTMNKVHGTDSWAYNPVPYDLHYNLYIGCKNTADGTQIIEQILPYFTPDWSVDVNLVPEINQSTDVIIVLNSVTSDDSYEGAIDAERDIIWTLSFTVKGMLFGQTAARSNLIKKVIVNIIETMNVNEDWRTSGFRAKETITITPGQDANGHATSNTSIAVPYTDVIESDPWAFITEFDETIS